MQGDEDKAFGTDHNFKPAIIMKRGDSFGELALLKATTRAATVVCLEKSEFFVVDQDAFFKYGIDSFSKEEIGYREARINSFGIFKHLEEDVRKEIAEKCHRLTYLSDKVVESDSSDSQYVYFVTRGCCYVLRLLDLPSKERERVSETKSEGRSILPMKCNQIPPVVDKNSLKTAFNIDSFGKVTYLPSIHGNNDKKQNKNLPSIKMSNSSNKLPVSRDDDKKSKMPANRFQSAPKTRNITNFNKSQPKPTGNRKMRAPKLMDRNLNRYCCSMNFGVGAFLKVDDLYPGRVFGLNTFLPEEDQETRMRRSRKKNGKDLEKY